LSQKYSISGLTKIFNSNQARFANYYKIVFTPETDVMAICADFSSQPDVVYAEPNGIYYAAGLPEPTDPLYIKQWALTKIQAPQAWEITTGNATVVVGVLDSGTDIGWPHLPSPHPDLETNLWNENGMYGYNVIDPGRQPYDNLGHGTHCAGVIGAVNNNATGVCGIAGGWGATPGVKVMTVKCLDSTGGTEEAILAEAVRWAADPDDNPATQDGARILGSVKSFV
jgi:thermitase